MSRWMRKRGGLLREAGIGRRGFQEWRYGVGGGLGVRCGCELFAKRWGGEKCGVSFTEPGAFVFKRHKGQSERKMGREGQ